MKNYRADLVGVFFQIGQPGGSRMNQHINYALCLFTVISDRKGNLAGGHIALILNGLLSNIF